MKNVRVKVRETCNGNWWDYAIYDGKKRLLTYIGLHGRKGNAVRAAKAMAKRIGIPFSDEIVKQHGC